MPLDDSEADRRRAATDKDIATAIQIVELRGDVKAHGALNKQRFDQIDGAINETKAAVHDVRTELTERVDQHEVDEKPYWEKLDTVRRLVWIAVGSIMILAAVITFGLSAIQRYIWN